MTGFSGEVDSRDAGFATTGIGHIGPASSSTMLDLQDIRKRGRQQAWILVERVMNFLEQFLVLPAEVENLLLQIGVLGIVFHVGIGPHFSLWGKVVKQKS